MKTYPYVYFCDRVVHTSEAKISLACNSLQYGTTAFAGIRGFVRESTAAIFRLSDHHERLMNASRILGFGFEIPYEDFFSIIEELISKNRPETDFYIRAFIFAPDEQLAPKSRGLDFKLGIYFVPLGHYFNPDQGMRLMVSSWKKFPDSALPTKAKAGGCYVNSFLATNEALRCGYDEALMTDLEGYIVEASVANIMISYRDTLIIPETGSAMLEGITLRSVVDLLEREGLKLKSERIDRSMAYTSKELLLFGTAAQVMYASSIDDRVLGKGIEGPVCKLLRSLFSKVLSEKHPFSERWLTKIPFQVKEHS